MMAKDDRLLISLDALYLDALGRATYTFAILEWNAVWCCERMEANYIRNLRKKTAGNIANDLVRMVEKLANPLRNACLGPAKQFQLLVETRNGILHGKPGTASGGAQRLFRNGIPWNPELLVDAADEFAACGILLNDLLHGKLKKTP